MSQMNAIETAMVQNQIFHAARAVIDCVWNVKTLEEKRRQFWPTVTSVLHRLMIQKDVISIIQKCSV